MTRNDLFYDMEDAIIDELRSARKERRNFSYKKIYDLEKVRYQHYLDMGQIKGLFIHDINLDNGSIIRIGFFEDGRPVIDVLRNGTVNHVLTRYSTENKDVSKAFELIDMLTDGGGVKPGIRMPDAFVQQMRSVRPGCIFTFGKATFFVSKVKDGVITCRKGYIKHSNLSDFDFSKEADFEINTNDSKSLLEFFREHKRLYRGAAEMRITTEGYAQKILEALAGDVKPGEARVIRMGVKNIHVQGVEDKTTHRRQLLFFDEKGKKIPKEALLCMIGWAETSSLSVKRVAMYNNAQSRVLNVEFKNRLQERMAESLKKKKEFEWFCEEIRRELEESEFPISIEVNGMQRTGEGYSSKTFIFDRDGKDIRIMSPVYDKDGTIKEMNPVNPIMAKLFIEQKFRENYAYFGERLSSGVEIDSRDEIERQVVENTFKMEPKRDVETLARTYIQADITDREKFFVEGRNYTQGQTEYEKAYTQPKEEKPVPTAEYTAVRQATTHIDFPDKVDHIEGYAVAHSDDEIVSSSSNGNISVSHESKTEYIPVRPQSLSEMGFEQRMAEARARHDAERPVEKTVRPREIEKDEFTPERSKY